MSQQSFSVRCAHPAHVGARAHLATWTGDTTWQQPPALICDGCLTHGPAPAVGPILAAVAAGIIANSPIAD